MEKTQNVRNHSLHLFSPSSHELDRHIHYIQVLGFLFLNDSNLQIFMEGSFIRTNFNISCTKLCFKCNGDSLTFSFSGLSMSLGPKLLEELSVASE
mmetsp:Transcript_7287/g.7989  ORF Transcript_7287/g.7989 Transcript_7287/m.7989 type:complete len:96 (+) Transcript_7287:622-909(+)